MVAKNRQVERLLPAKGGRPYRSQGGEGRAGDAGHGDGSSQDTRQSDAGGLRGAGGTAGRDRGAATTEALAPRGVGALADQALDLTFSRLGLLVGTASLFWWVVESFTMQGSATAPGNLIEGIERNLIYAPFLQHFILALATPVIYSAVQGHRLTAAQAWIRFLRSGLRWMRLMGLLLAFGLLSALVLGALVQSGFVLAAVLLPLPMLVSSWLFGVAPSVAALESHGALRSLSRSAQLTLGAFLRWLGLVVLQSILLSPLGSLPTVLAEFDVTEALGRRLGLGPQGLEAMLSVLTALVMGFGTAFGAVAMGLYYMDIRVRREGFDLDLRFAALGARSTEPHGVRGGGVRP